MTTADHLLTDHGLFLVPLAGDELEHVRGGLDDDFDAEDFDARR